MSIDQQPETRQTYEKPSFRTLSLVAEEVMAVGCKNPATNGPTPATTPCDIPGPCLQFGTGVS